MAVKPGCGLITRVARPASAPPRDRAAGPGAPAQPAGPGSLAARPEHEGSPEVGQAAATPSRRRRPGDADHVAFRLGEVQRARRSRLAHWPFPLGLSRAPPAGFEPAHPPPEGGALSPELWGLARMPGRARCCTTEDTVPVPAGGKYLRTRAGSARISSVKPIASRG